MLALLVALAQGGTRRERAEWWALNRERFSAVASYVGREYGDPLHVDGRNGTAIDALLEHGKNGPIDDDSVSLMLAMYSNA